MLTTTHILSEEEAESVVNLSDFALFLSVMRNKEAHRNILSIITDNEDLVLKRVHMDRVVQEVKQSEEWEAVRMSILWSKNAPPDSPAGHVLS